MRQKVVITIAVVLQMLLLVLVLAVANGQQLKQDWDASNFPNPTNAADVHRCGMRSQVFDSLIQWPI
jgi:hypothetical protein